MNIVTFHRGHLKNMVIQQRQRGMEKLLTDDICDVLESAESFSAFDGDEVLACAGVIEVAPGRAQAWAYVSDNVGNRMVGVTKAVRRFLSLKKYRRVEMDVDCDFQQAHRWAIVLGFEMECPRRKSFTPDGRDCALYAMVNV